jgi:gliding motility-associated protein GldE
VDIPERTQILSHILLQIIKPNLDFGDWLSIAIAILSILVLIVCSALFSGSENAFFSLSQKTLEELEENKDKASETILYFITHHKKLLATILIANNFVNVAVVLISSLIFELLFDFSEYQILGFVIQVVLVTFLLLVFGEIMPKVYAIANNLRIARIMAQPLYFLSHSFPLKYLVKWLEQSTTIIDKRITKKGHLLSVEELNQAIDLTTDEKSSDEEKDILRGIVNFGNISVKQIMKPRLDVVAFDQTTSFTELMKKVNEFGYSRIPIYEDNFDKVVGILSIKDLLPHLNQDDNFNWQQLLRDPFFVPETKKIDDLLKDFKEKRMHMAIVVDEYGGTSGIVTMEDVMEEIFGEINDEFDVDETNYSKLDDNTYVFEGKVLINDMCRLMDLDTSTFDEIRGDSDSLSGLLLEIAGKIPNIGARLSYKDFDFLIESADKRRIKRVKVSFTPLIESEEE